MIAHRPVGRDPIVRARGLVRTYRSGPVETPVLRGVDLDVPAGAFCALVGPSGSGKTTLLQLLGALDRPDAGTLEVDGVALHAATDAERLRFRRQHLGFVFQAFHLLPTLTAVENVQIVLDPLGVPRGEQRTRAEALLQELELGERMDHLPHQLSGGEQQRVAVARALVKGPRVVLADEPTGSVDRAGSLELVALMRALQQRTGATFVVVTHDPIVSDAATVVHALRDGHIVPA